MADLREILTKDLVEELVKREGVKEICVAPYQPYQLSIQDDALIVDNGPSRILVVID